MRAKAMAAFLLVVALAAQAGIAVGTGLSTEADATKAATAAAEQAKKALGEKSAKLVLVFESYPPADKPKLLDAVAAVFDKKLIHGCSAAGPITEQGNPTERSVAVCALGGDLEVAAAVSPTIGKDQRAAGEALGKALPKMANAKLMVLFGNCHVPSNQPLTEGVQSVLGKELPIIGGSSGGPSIDTFFQGEVKGDVAVGILLGGDFKLAICTLPGRGNDEVIRTAVAAVCDAAGKLGGKPAAGLLFECAGRRGMVKQLSNELAAIQGVLGTKLPLCGFYGTGEIGPINGVSTGVGYHVVCCLLGE
jgi:hypothetical protein